MALAIFDLDNTLIAGDSDHAWGEFLVEQNLVDGEEHKRLNDKFYADYLEGSLDIFEYLNFSLAPLARHPKPYLLDLRESFFAEKIRPLILEQGEQLIHKHRQQNDTILIITATNRFVTEPIAKALGVEHLIAVEVEENDNGYTGKPTGVPSYKEGKITRLEAWMDAHNETLQGSYFYSDSHNDLPLLKRVDYPVGVDPDDTLREFCDQQGWPTISLRG